VRRFCGWTEFQVRTHLTKLQDMEYIIPHHGGRGQSFVYELLFNGEDDGKPQMCGLFDVTNLKGVCRVTHPKDTTTVQTSSIETNGSSTQRASNEPGSRSLPLVADLSKEAASHVKSSRKSELPEIAQAPEELVVVVS
jgi:hypothetical protein